MTQHCSVSEFAKTVRHIEIAIVKSQRFLNLSSNLIADAFRRVLASERTHLGRCFTQKVGDVSQAELFLGQDSSEIL